MGKVQTTISIDEELKKKAQDMGYNISGELESHLRKRVDMKRNLPEENLQIICSLCREVITEGFWCRERNLVMCVKCEPKVDMMRCPHDSNGEHSHLKFPSIVLKKPGAELNEK